MTVFPLAADRETVNVAVVVPALPSVDGDVVHREAGRRVVVGDGAQGGAVGDRGVRGVRQRDREGLVGLVDESPFTVIAIVAVVAPAAIVRLPLALT